MKSITLKKPQPLDLFGLVTLQPGPNAVDPAVWAQVKDLKLGEMDVAYVRYAREQGFIVMGDDVPEPESAPAQPAPEPESAPVQEDEQPKRRGRPPKGT